MNKEKEELKEIEESKEIEEALGAFSNSIFKKFRNKEALSKHDLFYVCWALLCIENDFNNYVTQKLFVREPSGLEGLSRDYVVNFRCDSEDAGILISKMRQITILKDLIYSQFEKHPELNGIYDIYEKDKAKYYLEEMKRGRFMGSMRW